MVPISLSHQLDRIKASCATREYSQLNQNPEIEGVDQGLDPPVFHPISFSFVLCSLLPLYHRPPFHSMSFPRFLLICLPIMFPSWLFSSLLASSLSLPFFIPITLLGISLSYSLFCSLPPPSSVLPVTPSLSSSLHPFHHLSESSLQSSSLSFSQSAFLSSSLPHLLYSPQSSFTPFHLFSPLHSVFSSVFLPTFLYLYALLPHLISPSETIVWDGLWLFLGLII